MRWWLPYWSRALRDAVGGAYREAGCRRADERGRLDAAAAALLAAGAVSAHPRQAVRSIIREIASDRPGWLLKPTEDWALRQHRRYYGGRLRWRPRTGRTARLAPAVASAAREEHSRA